MMISSSHVSFNVVVGGESIELDAKFDGNNWYEYFLGIEGKSPIEIVEKAYQLILEESISSIDQLKQYMRYN
jgi:hypothetical protein